MKKALITGCSSGIGLAITQYLLERGWQVLGLSRNPLRAGVESSAFLPVAVDLEDLAALPDFLGALAHEHDDIAAVIANAGRGHFGGLEEFSYRQIGSLLDLNLTSQIYLARAFLPQFKLSGRGDLVFIGSEAALAGGPRGAVYSAAKAGVRGLAQSLRDECAKSGVRVSVVNPGAVATPFFTDLNIAPGDAPENVVQPRDVAIAVAMILDAPPGTLYDEINLRPLKRVIRSK